MRAWEPENKYSPLRLTALCPQPAHSSWEQGPLMPSRSSTDSDAQQLARQSRRACCVVNRGRGMRQEHRGTEHGL